jgi:hypothetical protein
MTRTKFEKKRLSSESEIDNVIDFKEEKALFKTQFKCRFRNCGKMGYKAKDFKARCGQLSESTIRNLETKKLTASSY